MKNVGYPAGVPTQFVWQNRVYPSRFHGGIWTRPVFGFPKIARPYDVFTPGYDINANIPQQPPISTTATMQGLGRLWNEGDGIFKPGGYGGGVFDGDISGLGSLTSRTKRDFRSVRGLGAADSYPWKEYSDATKQLQVATNESLKKAGMCPIATDGKLGGGTCGARNFLTANSKALLGQEMLFSNPPACADHENELVRPKALSTGCGSGGGTITLPAAPAAPLVVESGMSSSTKRTLGFALGGVLALGAIMVIRRKKG